MNYRYLPEKVVFTTKKFKYQLVDNNFFVSYNYFYPYLKPQLISPISLFSLLISSDCFF